MNKLGIERAKDGQIVPFVDLGNVSRFMHFIPSLPEINSIVSLKKPNKI